MASAGSASKQMTSLLIFLIIVLPQESVSGFNSYYFREASLVFDAEYCKLDEVCLCRWKGPTREFDSPKGDLVSLNVAVISSKLWPSTFLALPVSMFLDSSSLMLRGSSSRSSACTISSVLTSSPPSSSLTKHMGLVSELLKFILSSLNSSSTT